MSKSSSSSSSAAGSTTTYASGKKYSIYPDTEYPAPEVRLDEELLTTICSIQGISRYEGDMQAYLLQFLKDMGLSPSTDKLGNVYATKGEAEYYPCMVAHMDTVHSWQHNFQVAKSTDGKVLYAIADGGVKDENLPLLSMPVKQAGIGGDDRCGIYVALHWLRLAQVGKVAFFVEEECGTVGSRGSNASFFADTSVVLQCDRQGSQDWVQTVAGTQVSSNEFITSIKDLLDHHAYKTIQSGGITDVGALKQKGLPVCAANMSCGYYRPHSAEETIFLPALENTLNLCLKVLARVGGTPQPHEHVAKTYSSYGGGGNGSYAGYNGASRSTAGYNAGGTNYSSGSSSFGNHAGKREPSLLDFYPTDFGWAWEKGERGFTKTVAGVKYGPMQYMDVRELEVKWHALRVAAKAGNPQLTGAELKAKKAEIRLWIAKDKTWDWNAAEKWWEKTISDKGSKEYWVGAYAKSLLDIPMAEKEFQLEWDGWDDENNLSGAGTGFNAKDISVYVTTAWMRDRRKEAAEKANKKAQEKANGGKDNPQLPFDEASKDSKVVGSLWLTSGAERDIPAEDDDDDDLTDLEFWQHKAKALGTLPHGNLIDPAKAIPCPVCGDMCETAYVKSHNKFFCTNCVDWNEVNTSAPAVQEVKEATAAGIVKLQAAMAAAPTTAVAYAQQVALVAEEKLEQQLEGKYPVFGSTEGVTD